MWKALIGKFQSSSPGLSKRFYTRHKIKNDFVESASCGVMEWPRLPNLHCHWLLFKTIVYVEETWIKDSRAGRFYMEIISR
jgi:hypothetical protein